MNPAIKIMTILGTRPEIIRFAGLFLSWIYSVIIFSCILQNFDRTLNEIFFTELKLRSPDYLLDCQAPTLMGQIGQMLSECEQVMFKGKPDRLLILGETNRVLTAMVAKRLRIY